MKITTFNPQIFTKDAEPLVRLFEEMGFQKRHDKEEIGELKVEGIRMKDSNGFHLDISVPKVPLPRDMVGIRMNVDDFDECYRMLKEKGFKNVYGEDTAITATSRSAVMISPSGCAINLVKHIKNKV